MAVCFLSCRGDGCSPLWWWTAAGCHGNQRPPQPRQLHRSSAVSSLGIGCGGRDVFPCWGAGLPLSLSWVIEMYWPYLTWLGIIGWGCLFLAWKSIMAYWNTSLLSCGKTYIPGVVCFFCLAGMLSPHLFPCQSTSTTLDFLSWINQILYLLFSHFVSYISVLHEQV